MPYPYIDEETGMRRQLPGEKPRSLMWDSTGRVVNIPPVTKQELDDDLLAARKKSMGIKHSPPLKAGRSRRRKVRKTRKTRRHSK